MCDTEPPCSNVKRSNVLTRNIFKLDDQRNLLKLYVCQNCATINEYLRGEYKREQEYRKEYYKSYSKYLKMFKRKYGDIEPNEQQKYGIQLASSREAGGFYTLNLLKKVKDYSKTNNISTEDILQYIDEAKAQSSGEEKKRLDSLQDDLSRIVDEPRTAAFNDENEYLDGGQKKTQKLISIRPAPPRSPKKYVATFEVVNNKSGGRSHRSQKRVQFGQRGYSDYTIHKDPERKERYLNRHRKRENWSDPTSPGALSRYILWESPSLKTSIRKYKQRFHL